MLEPYTMDEAGIPFRRNNFLSVEIPLHEPMPCPRFRSFALMRDPFKRCLSHLSFEGIPEVIVLKRQLLGRARYLRPRPIDDKDFEQAKIQLDKFTAFVPLEFLRHEKVLALLNQTVPEYYEGLIENFSRSNEQPPTNLTYSENVIRRIQEENKYDTMLCDYMLKKLGLDSKSTDRVPMRVSTTKS